MFSLLDFSNCPASNMFRICIDLFYGWHIRYFEPGLNEQVWSKII